MPDKPHKDELLKRLLKEVEPEVTRIHADHDRIMQLIAKIPEPTEAPKPAIREASPPAGWQVAKEGPRAKPLEQKTNKNVLVWIISMALGVTLGVAAFLLAG